MAETIYHVNTAKLVVVKCWCGVHHAVPIDLREVQIAQQLQREEVDPIYCPLGHQHIPRSESEAQRLARELARERASHDQTRAELAHTESRRRAERAAKTRLKNRVGRGVCPCCNRSFENLGRHMATKHPEFVAEEED